MNAIINGKNVSFEAGDTILSVAKKNGFFIPSLCAFTPLDHKPGVCRVCLVECTPPSGEPCIVPACVTPMEEGMRVETATPDVRARQRMQVELLLREHRLDCEGCNRRGECELQSLREALGMDAFRPAPEGRALAPAAAGPLVRDMDKCVRCLRCTAMCRRQGAFALRADSTGKEEGIIEFTESACLHCGQCARVCPVGAITERDDTASALAVLSEPDAFTVAAFTTSARDAVKGVFSALSCSDLEGRLVAALRHLGADAVISADFTSGMAAEAVSRELKNALENKTLPLFSAACPAWADYAARHFPDSQAPALSDVRAPQLLASVLNRKTLAQHYGVTEDKVRILLVSPCTPLKNGDFDAVLSARGLFRLMNESGIQPDTVAPESFDRFPVAEQLPCAGMYGEITGAVLRSLGARIHSITETADLVETEAEFGSSMLRTALCFSCEKAAELAGQAGEGLSPYAFIEVMACPGGCPGGGGSAAVKNDAGRLR